MINDVVKITVTLQKNRIKVIDKLNIMKRKIYEIKVSREIRLNI